MHEASKIVLSPPLSSPMCPHLSSLSAQCSAVSLQPTRLTTASWASWWSSTSTPATSSTSTTSRGRTSRWFTARWTTSGRYVCSKNHLQRNNFKCQTSNGNLSVAGCRSSDPAYRPLGPLFFNIFKRTLTLWHFFGGREVVGGGGITVPCDKTPPGDLPGFCMLFGPAQRLGISALSSVQLAPCTFVHLFI